MKNKSSKARMQMIFGALLFALILMAELYVMINYPEWYIVIAALAVLGLGFLYMLVNGFLVLKEQRDIRREEQYESIFKSEKASYLMLKKYFEEIEDKLNYLEKASKVPTEEIINAQKGIAKVIVNRHRENTEALMSSNDMVVEQMKGLVQKAEELSSSITDNHGEIESNRNVIEANREAVAAIVNAGKDQIIETQKTMKESAEQAAQVRGQELVVSLKDMEIRLNNAIMQCQKAISEIQVMTAQPVITMPQMQEPKVETPVVQAAPVQQEPVAEDSVIDEFTEDEIDVDVPELDMNIEELDAEETEMDNFAEDITADIPMEISTEPAGDMLSMPDLSDPNKKMSARDVDALLADMGVELDSLLESMPEEEPEPDFEDVELSLDDTAAMLEEEPEPMVEEPAPMPDLSDPNKPMSPDDIAALLANMETADEVSSAGEEPDFGAAELSLDDTAAMLEEEPEPIIEEPAPMPDLSDPNKQMSPDDIAALFANMNEEPAAAVEPEPEPVMEEPAPMPDLSDPNKQMSADDIAALFASMGA